MNAAIRGNVYIVDVVADVKVVLYDDEDRDDDDDDDDNDDRDDDDDDDRDDEDDDDYDVYTFRYITMPTGELFATTFGNFFIMKKTLKLSAECSDSRE